MTYRILAATVAAMSLSASVAVLAADTAPANSVRAEKVGPDGRTVQVTALSNSIYRVDNFLPGKEPAASRTVVAREGQFTGDVADSGSAAVITSPSGVIATLDKATGAVTLTAGGKAGLFDSGARTVTADGKQQIVLYPVGDTRAFYGGGERGYSYNLKGQDLGMYNTQNYGYQAGEKRLNQMNITMPLLISPDGYGVLMDDYAAADMTVDNPVTYTTEAPGSVSYYFFASEDGTMPGLADQLGRLTGRQELPPFWSLGYISSKYGYHDQRETLGVADTLKTRGYPLDGMVLDLYWYGKEQDMGRLAWDPEQWPDHKKMLAHLKKKGVNMIIISQPFVLKNGRGIDNYNFLSQRGMLGKDSVGGTKDVTIWVGEGGMLDMSNPDTRKWLRERYRQLTDEGVTGWWGDLGEPECHPAGMHHANGLTGRLYHNLYGNDWSSIIKNLFEEEYPETRLMTMMRGGTAGLQRYSVFPWSTDVSRSWGGLQPQIKIMLNAGLSGLGYMGHDVGGFAVDPEHPYNPELYVRWCQLGLFSPVLRTHAQQFANPYDYPEQEQILLPLIRERYRWLPYNYTLASENARFSLPLVRPLGYYDADPAALDSITDQYLWGRDVMVAPVLTPGTTERSVVFPSGRWVDINNPANVYAGGTTATVAAPLEVLPLFARAGALLPKADYKMENTGDYNPARYTIDYYPTPDCGKTTFTLYEDDRTSRTSLATGNYALIDITADNTARATTLKVAASTGSYAGMPAKRTITFVLHNVDRPAKVTGTAKVKQTYDAATRTLTLTATSALPLDITVTK